MPTASKKKSLVTQVSDLDAEIKKARLETARLRREINAYDDDSRARDAALVARRETHPEEHAADGYTASPDTETARLHDELRDRVESPNPLQAQRDKAVTHLHQLEQKQRRLKIIRTNELTIEIAGTTERWTQEFQEPLRVLLDVIERYQASQIELERFLDDVPALAGRDVVSDGRVGAWADFVRSAVNTEVVAPSIGAEGQWNLDRLRGQIESGQDV